jgi:F0F1-type ATP synthase membrane subunit b/b'
MNPPRLFVSVMILGISLSTCLWAQTPSTSAAPSHAQIKREAELQKKAAEAKQKWAKAEEKVKKLEQELEKAKLEAARARQEADKAQQLRDAVKMPSPK